MRRTSRRVAVMAAAVSVSALCVAYGSTGSGAVARTRQAPHPSLTVTPTSGTTAERFTATGTGCADGWVTVRVDMSAVHNIPTGADGKWTWTEPFPSPRGHHQVKAICSDQTTAGAPTTFAGPGTKRFDYAPVAIETVAPPSITAATEPTTPAAVPSTPPAAVPTPATSEFTG
jgi:hypothetical protein